MLEKKVIEKVKKVFKNTFKKCDFNKIHVSPLHNRGFPDLVIITDLGTFFLEVKGPGKKLTKLQRAKLNLIKECSGEGTKSYWVTYREDKSLVFLDPGEDEVVCTVKI